MKNSSHRFSVPLICVIMLFLACTKQPLCGCTPVPPTGVFGLNTGKAWRATNVTDSVKNDSAYIYAKTDTDMLKFTLKATSNNHNVYTVPDNYDASYYVIKGTYGKLTYILDKAAINNIEVSYGGGEKAGNVPNVWIFSKFNLTFKLATPTGNTAFDDKRVNFSDGIIGYGLQN